MTMNAQRKGQAGATSAVTLYMDKLANSIIDIINSDIRLKNRFNFIN